VSFLLEVRNLKKYFNTPAGMLHAVDDVSFGVEEGKTLGVVGESGCGKSTLGRVILHLLSSTEGKIFFEGEDITKPNAARLHQLCRQMQMIFQDPFSSIDPRMTVSQLLGEPLLVHKLFSDKNDYRKQIRNIMDTVGLASRLENTYPHELDGGRRQRIGIGRALILKPRFIVCDEPVSSLDMSIQAQILNLMQDLQKELGLTYIFITHDLSVVKHISNDILVMYLGVVVEKTNAKELFVKQYHPYTKALLSAIPRLQIHKKSERIILKSEITSPIEPPDICRFAPRCDYVAKECATARPELAEKTPDHFVACCRADKIYCIE
jgi:peptide/nickel transport system ATP-binding protein